MKNNGLEIWVMSKQKHFPKEKMMLLKEQLDKVPVDKVGMVTGSVELKDPNNILLMSIFLGGFGVDRFMLGDTGLGVAKLLLGWVTFGIWWVVDIFLTPKKAREVNYNTIMQMISGYTNTKQEETSPDETEAENRLQ
ncbi:MAG: TM2 domain-containing protein [Defluviitaleaceae bacterium]|nr:TM2 domain-containing protein [Defluviitaleaceae bacterium]